MAYSYPLKEFFRFDKWYWLCMKYGYIIICDEKMLKKHKIGAEKDGNKTRCVPEHS